MTMNIVRFAAPLVGCLLLMAGGCVNLKKPAVEKRYYRIEALRSANQNASVSPNVLKVRRLRISPSYSGKGLVYKTGASTYASDFYHAYFISPSDMLTQELLDWLAASQIFSHVVDPASLVRSDMVLEGVVNALYGDYSMTPHKAVLRMQFFLLDESTLERSIVFAKDYNREKDLYSDSPARLIRTQSENLASILNELETDLRRVAAGRGE
jgi:cholesterol transport system auxiliary component